MSRIAILTLVAMLVLAACAGTDGSSQSAQPTGVTTGEPGFSASPAASSSASPGASAE